MESGHFIISVDLGLVGAFADYATSSDNLTAFGIGGLIGFSGISIAAGYQNTDGDTRQDNWSADFGVGYSTGPWTIAGGYVHGENDLNNDEYDYVSLSVDYNITSGVSVYATIGAGSVEGGAAEDNDYTVLSTGLKTSF